MAKFVISGDTESKELSVKLNGESIEDVGYVNVCLMPAYNYDGKDYEEALTISISTSKEEGDVRKYSSIVAKNTKDGVEAISAGAKEFTKCAEFVEIPKVDLDISKFIKRKNK